MFCGDREPCIHGSITKERANTLVPVIAGFITSCSAEQIRFVPDKCMDILI